MTTPQVEKIGTVAHNEVAGAGRQKRNLGGDLGAKWLESYTGELRPLTAEDSEKIRKKIDMYLMPVCCLIYFCQQLDKSSISNAAVFGLKTDAHLHGSQYSWLSSIIYFAQLVFQPLSVYALIKFPVNYWILFCFFGWGASCMILTAFKSFAGLLVFRFILGAFESSISPSMLIIVSMWWTRREQPMRNVIWYSANSIALILGSLLAYGLAKIETTSLYTYQLIFVVSGAIAVACVIPAAFILPGHPTKARFLTEDEKYLALERVKLNNTGTQNTEFKWDQLRECFLDIKSYGWAIMVFCVSLVSGGVGAFGPLILQGFGLDTFQTILYNMIPSAVALVANIIAAYIVTKTMRKMPVLLGVAIFPVASAAALYAMPRGAEYKHKLLAVYFILYIFQPLTPLIFSWALANTAGHTKKTATTAFLFVGLCTGNIVGPQLYKEKESPYYHTGLTGNMIVLCIMFGVIILQGLYLAYLNRQNVKRREALGKTGRKVDYSLQDSSKWEQLRREDITEPEEGAGKTTDNMENEHGLDDLSDLRNEDFVYSL